MSATWSGRSCPQFDLERQLQLLLQHAAEGRRLFGSAIGIDDDLGDEAVQLGGSCPIAGGTSLPPVGRRSCLLAKALHEVSPPLLERAGRGDLTVPAEDRQPATEIGLRYRDASARNGAKRRSAPHAKFFATHSRIVAQASSKVIRGPQNIGEMASCAFLMAAKRGSEAGLNAMSASDGIAEIWR